MNCDLSDTRNIQTKLLFEYHMHDNKAAVALIMLDERDHLSYLNRGISVEVFLLGPSWFWDHRKFQRREFVGELGVVWHQDTLQYILRAAHVNRTARVVHGQSGKHFIPFVRQQISTWNRKLYSSVAKFYMTGTLAGSRWVNNLHLRFYLPSVNISRLPAWAGTSGFCIVDHVAHNFEIQNRLHHHSLNRSIIKHTQALRERLQTPGRAAAAKDTTRHSYLGLSVKPESLVDLPFFQDDKLSRKQHTGALRQTNVKESLDAARTRMQSQLTQGSSMQHHSLLNFFFFFGDKQSLKQLLSFFFSSATSHRLNHSSSSFFPLAINHHLNYLFFFFFGDKPSYSSSSSCCLYLMEMPAKLWSIMAQWRYRNDMLAPLRSILDE
ncbi:unnamed protein product [Fusarium graminearum]|uniref:Uncharacterized protein n=1 Tax=Gibberella zeae TaxID=5518 RepID=A0A9N8WUG7_GIBZA|nr:unnamed protein product [Fusarium graminearum]